MTAKQKLKRLISFCLLISVILCGMGVNVNADSAENQHTVSSENPVLLQTYKKDDTSYFSYFLQHKNDNRPRNTIQLYPEIASVFDGENAFITREQPQSLAMTFSIPETGCYYFAVTYQAMPEDTGVLQTSLQIDGQFPYAEAQHLELSRCYRDKLTDGKFDTDQYGNDIRPSAEEIYRWIRQPVMDTTGLYDEPYLFSLEKGEHTLNFSATGAMAISLLEFYNTESPVSYEEYLAQYEKKAPGEQDIIRQEAELTYEKNAQGLYPTHDQTDASTLPSSPSSIRLNTVGQSSWSRQGQYISWKADVKSAGLYSLSFRANQSYNENGSSYRRLLINGAVPFAEAESIAFPYSVKWYVTTLGGKDPYYVYLEPGDIVTLECVNGDTSEISQNINRSLSRLSEIYREIIVITGTSPDAYRDYNLDVKIPTLKDELNEVREMLTNTTQLISKKNGKNSTVSTLNQVIYTLSQMIEKPYAIQEQVENLSGNIESMGSLVMSVGLQPLELDCFYFTPCNAQTAPAKKSLIKRITYHAKRFLCSFTGEYDNSFNNDKTLKVWVSTGRDQLNILQRMIEDDFENKNDVKIRLSLVDTGTTLIQATLAGKGPDVALLIGNETPVNLAVRGALVDLKKYDIASLHDSFYPSAWTPFVFRDGIYAIPETQTFDMLFYRSDICETLGIDIPQTWDEFYAVLQVLQRNNLEVGIPEINAANAGVSLGISTFSRFLLQNGGTYYTNDFHKTAFDSDAAYRSFTEWVQLYSKYGLDRSYDFFSRFRTGVMVMAIQNYQSYNQLYSAAPEIRGLWKMAAVPGVLNEDGTVNRSETSTGTGCIMLQSAENKGLGQEAFDFMKWWTSAEVQTIYAGELESTMGIAARYAPANKTTFSKIGWSGSEYEVLQLQMSRIANFAEIPGNYVLPRALTSAFRKAINSIELPERQLEIYNKDINDELERKAKEFDLY